MAELGEDNGELIRDLGSALARGQSGLSSVRSLIRLVVRERTWRRFMIPDTGRLVSYREDEFLAFVAAAPPDGLGATLAVLERLCGDDLLALSALEAASQRAPGGDRYGKTTKTSNAHVEPLPRSATTSGSRRSSLRRLRHARPDLLERVIQGELSPYRAMVEAGLRRAQITVPRDIERAANVLRRTFPAHEITRLVQILTTADLDVSLGGGGASRPSEEPEPAPPPPGTSAGGQGELRFD